MPKPSAWTPVATTDERDTAVLRHRVAQTLEIRGEPSRWTRAVNWFLLALIAANLVAMVLESVESYRAAAPAFFYWFERISLYIFAMEYVARLWSCTALPEYRDPIAGRVRFAITPLALVDLLAVLPLLMPAIGVDLRSGRVLRLFRVFRVAKFARYSRTLHLFARVFRARASELVTVMLFLAALLLLAASLMYYAEHDAQPQTFSSIPTTLWWAIATLSTVGYGDVYPVTDLGRVIAGVICVLGIGMFALPTSILGAAFAKEISAPTACPHCGKEPDS